jgi:ankyrin repeat protein
MGFKNNIDTPRYFYLAILLLPIIILFYLYGSGQLDSELLKEIKKGNIEGVRHLLSTDNKKTNEYSGTLTPLHQAAYYSQLEIAEILIQHGADVNAKGGRHNFSPIFISVSKDDINFLKLLIKNGADINLKDDLNKTPLICAAQDDNLESVKVLLGAGAEDNVKDSSGKSALDYAIRNQNVDMIGLMGSPIKGAVKRKNTSP